MTYENFVKIAGSYMAELSKNTDDTDDVDNAAWNGAADAMLAVGMRFGVPYRKVAADLQREHDRWERR